MRDYMYLYGEWLLHKHVYNQIYKRVGCYISMKGITVYSSTIDENEEDCRILYFYFNPIPYRMYNIESHEKSTWWGETSPPLGLRTTDHRYRNHCCCLLRSRVSTHSRPAELPVQGKALIQTVPSLHQRQGSKSVVVSFRERKRERERERERANISFVRTICCQDRCKKMTMDVLRWLPYHILVVLFV